MLTLDSASGLTKPRKTFRLSRHARLRTHARRFGVVAIEAAMAYGRVVFVRGAEIHAIGRKEVLRCRRRGIDLQAFEGIQVVCRPGASVVLTAYRNRDFRGLRPYRHHASRARKPLPVISGQSLPTAN